MKSIKTYWTIAETKRKFNTLKELQAYIATHKNGIIAILDEYRQKQTKILRIRNNQLYSTRNFGYVIEHRLCRFTTDNNNPIIYKKKIIHFYYGKSQKTVQHITKKEINKLFTENQKGHVIRVSYDNDTIERALSLLKKPLRCDNNPNSYFLVERQGMNLYVIDNIYIIAGYIRHQVSNSKIGIPIKNEHKYIEEFKKLMSNKDPLNTNTIGTRKTKLRNLFKSMIKETLICV